MTEIESSVIEAYLTGTLTVLIPAAAISLIGLGMDIYNHVKFNKAYKKFKEEIEKNEEILNSMTKEDVSYIEKCIKGDLTSKL